MCFVRFNDSFGIFICFHKCDSCRHKSYAPCVCVRPQAANKSTWMSLSAQRMSCLLPLLLLLLFLVNPLHWVIIIMAQRLATYARLPLCFLPLLLLIEGLWSVLVCVCVTCRVVDTLIQAEPKDLWQQNKNFAAQTKQSAINNQVSDSCCPTGSRRMNPNCFISPAINSKLHSLKRKKRIFSLWKVSRLDYANKLGAALAANVHSLEPSECPFSGYSSVLRSFCTPNKNENAKQK